MIVKIIPKFNNYFLFKLESRNGLVRWSTTSTKCSTVGRHVFKYAQGHTNIKNTLKRSKRK